MTAIAAGSSTGQAGCWLVHIDRERDLGEYWGPNIWVIHTPGR
jgi:hypothetical protein